LLTGKRAKVCKGGLVVSLLLLTGLGYSLRAPRGALRHGNVNVSLVARERGRKGHFGTVARVPGTHAVHAMLTDIRDAVLTLVVRTCKHGSMGTMRGRPYGKGTACSMGNTARPALGEYGTACSGWDTAQPALGGIRHSLL